MIDLLGLLPHRVKSRMFESRRNTLHEFQHEHTEHALLVASWGAVALPAMPGLQTSKAITRQLQHLVSSAKESGQGKYTACALWSGLTTQLKTVNFKKQSLQLPFSKMALVILFQFCTWKLCRQSFQVTPKSISYHRNTLFNHVEPILWMCSTKCNGYWIKKIKTIITTYYHRSSTTKHPQNRIHCVTCNQVMIPNPESQVMIRGKLANWFNNWFWCPQFGEIFYLPVLLLVLNSFPEASS